MEQAQSSADKYDIEKDRDLNTGEPDYKIEPNEMVFKAGQSKRIWNELHKVSVKNRELWSSLEVESKA